MSPIYDFKNTATGKVFEQSMKIAEKTQFLLDNPDIESYHGSPPNLGDPVRLGVRKVDSGFKEVLQKISERAPGGKVLHNNSTQTFS